MINIDQFIFHRDAYETPPEGWYEHFHFIEDFSDSIERELYVWVHKNAKKDHRYFIGRCKSPIPALIKIWFEDTNDLIMFKLIHGGGEHGTTGIK